MYNFGASIATWRRPLRSSSVPVFSRPIGRLDPISDAHEAFQSASAPEEGIEGGDELFMEAPAGTRRGF